MVALGDLPCDELAACCKGGGRVLIAALRLRSSARCASRLKLLAHVFPALQEILSLKDINKKCVL